MKIQVSRFKTSDQGTLGVLVSPAFLCHTIELPWRENKQNISCIPTGIYDAEWYPSSKYGMVILIKNVPSRFGILFHYGNWAGDESKGHTSNSDGCIIVGKSHNRLNGQDAVLSSRAAFNYMNRILSKYDEFKIKVEDWLCYH